MARYVFRRWEWAVPIVMAWIFFDPGTPNPAFAAKPMAFGMFCWTGMLGLGRKRSHEYIAEEGVDRRRAALATAWLFSLLVCGAALAWIYGVVGRLQLLPWVDSSWDAVAVWSMAFAAGAVGTGLAAEQLRSGTHFLPDGRLMAAVLVLLGVVADVVNGVAAGISGMFPLGNPNLNGYAAAGLLLLLIVDRHGLQWPCRHHDRSWQRTLTSAAALAAVAWMVLSSSRGAAIALGLGLLPAFGSKWGSQGARKGTVLGLLGIAALLAVVVLGWTDSPSLDLRRTWWQGSWQLWKAHPVWGIGLGRWMLDFPATGLASEASHIVARRPHNMWLRLLSELGIVHVVLLLTAYGWVWLRWFRGHARMAHGPLWSGLGLAGTLAFSFDLVAESFVFAAAAVAWWFWGSGIWFSPEAKDSDQENPRRGLFARLREALFDAFRRWSVLALIVSFCCAAAFSVLAYWRWEAASGQFLVEQARLAEDWTGLTEAMDDARRLGVVQQEDGLPLDWLEARQIWRVGDTTQTRVLLAGALRSHPWCGQVRNDAAALALAEARYADALEHLDVAVRISPGRANIHYNRAIALHKLGRNADALKALEAIDPGHCPADLWDEVQRFQTALKAVQ